jgi:pantoate--beta-alanine ligase
MATKIKVIKTVAAMQAWSEKEKRAGRSVGCVPTMGCLHEGHVSLIRACAQMTDRVVMTLFVNPTQFAPHEDLAKYPRDFEGDCQKAAAGGAAAVFYPSAAEMYPEGYQTYVGVEELTRDLEGAFRPTHFRGVTTVCMKLFNAVRPAAAVFGEKDYQQLKVVERMVRDLNLGLRIVGLPTVREPDGLAMSSRNVYLSREEREQALSISRALFAARQAVRDGEDRPKTLMSRARKSIAAAGLDIDYVEIRDAETLGPIKKITGPARLLVAARAGKTRLIDNLEL